MTKTSHDGVVAMSHLGHEPVLAGRVQWRRLSEVERTSRPRKRTLPLEGRLLGVERSKRRYGRNRRL